MPAPSDAESGDPPPYTDEPGPTSPNKDGSTTMRIAPRKLRPFRPSTLALEAICPVSSLATELPASTLLAGSMDAEPDLSRPPARVAQAPATTMIAPVPVADRMRAEVAISAPVPVRLDQPTGSVAEVDVDRYKNAITLAGAIPPSARQTSPLSQANDAGGGGGGGMAAASPGPNIRPMTLAADPGGDATAAADEVTSGGAMTMDSYSSMSGWDSGGGSGGGSTSSSSGSSSSIEYRAWITAVGKHEDDPSVSWDDSSGDVPEQTQGEAWMSGGGTSVILKDAATGAQQYDWTLEKATWSLPGGMIKGYGEFSEQYERSDDPSNVGAYTAFMGDPVETADVKGFDADDLEYEDGTLEVNDHVFGEAFFGADAVGEVAITVNATFRNNADPQKKVTKSDTVKVAVNQPKGKMTRLKFGTSAGVAPFGPGTQILQFDKNFTSSNGNVGVLYKCTVYDTKADGTPLAPGVFKVAQTVDRTATRQKADGAVLVKEQHPLNRDGTSPGMVRDKDPYDGNIDDPGEPRNAGQTLIPIGRKFYFNDSPGMTLATGWDSYKIKDSLRATLMYKPNSAGRRGSYVPVEVVNWSWEGNAVWQGTAYGDAANPAPTADSVSSSTTQSPVYTKKIA